MRSSPNGPINPDYEPYRSRKSSIAVDNAPLNGSFGEIRCTAKRSLLHARRNAAPAKVKNRMAVLSAQPPSIVIWMG